MKIFPWKWVVPGRYLPVLMHGGLPDRFDSALFVLPFTVLYLRFCSLW